MEVEGIWTVNVSLKLHERPDLNAPIVGLEQDSNTAVGRVLSSVVPSPSCPYEFAPQHSRVPLTVTTHVFLSPQASKCDLDDSSDTTAEEFACSARDSK